MPHLAEGPLDYKKQQEAIKRKLSSAAKSSGSKILAAQAKKENRDRPEIQEMVQMARMLFDEGMEMYRSGDMSFEDMSNDLHRSLMAISGHKKRMDKEAEGEDET